MWDERRNKHIPLTLQPTTLPRREFATYEFYLPTKLYRLLECLEEKIKQPIDTIIANALAEYFQKN